MTTKQATQPTKATKEATMTQSTQTIPMSLLEALAPALETTPRGARGNSLRHQAFTLGWPMCVFLAAGSPSQWIPDGVEPNGCPKFRAIAPSPSPALAEILNTAWNGEDPKAKETALVQAMITAHHEALAGFYTKPKADTTQTTK